MVKPKTGLYTKSFYTLSTLLVLGFILNLSFGASVIVPEYPNNLIIGVGFTLFIVLSFVFLLHTTYLKLLMSIPFTVVTLGAFTFLVLLMGFIPQVPRESPDLVTRMGLNQMLDGFPFALVFALILYILGLITLKRLFPFNRTNAIFLLNHFGLWFCLLTASLGSSDITRVRVKVDKDNYTYSGFDQKKRPIQDLGIALKLKEFRMEIYNPKLYIIDSKSGEILSEEFIVIDKGNKGKVMDWEVEILEYYEHSAFNEQRYHKIYDEGSVPSAKILWKNSKTNESDVAWISCGNFKNRGSAVKLTDKAYMVMTEPEPKRFASDIEILTNNQKAVVATIDVNKPLNVNDWRIYQFSYDTDRGRWSDHSIIELVNDPWIDYVYAGLYLLLIGSALIFWQGNKNNQASNPTQKS